MTSLTDVSTTNLYDTSYMYIPCARSACIWLKKHEDIHVWHYNDFYSMQVAKFPFLGRIHHSVTTMKDSTFESKAYGKRVNKLISIEGRVQFDLLQVRK